MSRPCRPRLPLAALLGALLACAGLLALAPSARANVSVIPVNACDWKYQIYPTDPPAGWSAPGFDDGGFALGCAPFGVQGDCEIGVRTAWPLDTRIVLRKQFDLPDSTRRILVFATLDDEVTVYVNGVQVGSESSAGDECSGYNRVMFSAPGAILQPTGNVIAVLGYGYGGHSLLAVAVDADVSVPPPPPPPQPPTPVYGCKATDALADHVQVTWYAAQGQTGYHVYRDGVLVGSPGQMETSFLDTPDVGTYAYCVEAYNDAGASARCCDSGTRLPYAAPAPCGASDAGNRQILVSWTDVVGEAGYHVYRGSDLIYTAAPNEISYADYPAPGTYTYCIEAFGPLGTSPMCCDAGTRLPLTVPYPCAASDDSPTEVLVTWKNVDDEDGYHVYRGGTLVHTAGRDETSWSDTPEPGVYPYCVEAVNAQGVSPQCCDNGTRRAPSPSPCDASSNRMDGVRVTWTDVAGESGYRVYRGSTLVATTGPDVSSWLDVPPVGSYVYCVEVFYPSGVTARCCHSGQRLALPVPAPCGATVSDPTGITVTWTAVEGAIGYRVFRDGVLVREAGPAETSFFDVPAPGTYMYCVSAVYSTGTSAGCCGGGRRPALPGPNSCNATDTDTVGVTVTWTDVAGAAGYRIYRADALIATLGAGQGTYFDLPAPGTYSYCVEAFNDNGPSDRCCDSGTRFSAAAQLTCSASDNLSTGVRLDWTAVPGVTGYHLYRDGVLFQTAGASATTAFDVPSPDTYTYCVEPFTGPILWTPCCDEGTRLVQGPGGAETVRLSWDVCSPWIQERAWAGPAVYKLVVSAAGLTGGFNGHDTSIFVTPWVVDAWRFDDLGCQAGYFQASTAGVSKSCPALLGTAPLSIVNYGCDPSVQNVIIRVANTFNEFTADPSVRYTLWQLSFDHTYSVAGPSLPDGRCGGAELGEHFYAMTQFLHADGRVTDAAGDERWAFWNAGAVMTVPTTWSRVKATYR